MKKLLLIGFCLFTSTIQNGGLPKFNMNQKGDAMVNIGLDQAVREQSGKILNIVLADEYLLYTKTYNYHWNVVGVMFNDLHKFFEGQYEQLEDFVDAVAERARSVGVRALGTMSEFVQNSRLKEDAPGVVPEAKQMIKNLLVDHEAIIRSLRADIEKTAGIGDMGTNNFLTDLLERHEKMAWMLRAYLQ